MARTRVGVVGAGFIGEAHLKAVCGHEQFEVVGLCDQSPALASARSEQFGVPIYADHIALIEQGRPDYITVCTPHYSHTGLAIEAMNRGVHALIEKPLTVAASAGEECLEVMRRTGMIAGVGFLMRLHPLHQRLYDLLRSGFLGELQRVSMVRTNWFRSMAYYNSNPWRGTWQGEGGGILVNQAPHDLDLLVWTAGLPSEVLVEANTTGHDIEVEDDVSALLKWPGGATGVLQVSTAEAPGRSFYELAGTKGALRLEEDTLRVTRLSMDSREFSETTTERMEPPPVAEVTVYEQPEDPLAFRYLHENFAAALTGQSPVLCTLEEGLAEVQLANAMLLSGLSRRWTPVPTPAADFDEALAGLIASGSLTAFKQARGG